MCNEDKIFYRSLDCTQLCGIFTMPEKPKGFALMAHGITMDKNEWNGELKNSEFFVGDIECE